MEIQEKQSKLNFNTASFSDIETLVEMMRELCEHDHRPFEKEGGQKALHGIIENELFGRAFLITLREEVIGYMVITFGYSLEFHGRDAFIDELYFKEEHRGRGYGKTALEFAANFCRDNSVKALHLEVERTNTIAQAFYKKADFEDLDRYLMTKWL